MRHNLPLDIGIPIACALLFGIGLTAIYSVSLAADAGWTTKQLMWAPLAAAAAASAACCSLSSLRRHVGWLMAAVIVGLVAALFFEPSHGANRWLRFGGLSLQPSEFCKWSVLLMAAHYASRPHYQRRQTVFVLPVILWLAMPLALLVLQRDFGALILISLTALVILFLAGLGLRWVALLAMLLTILAVILIYLEPYRMQRLTSFIDPFTAVGGYNQKNAIMAFVLGELWGRGIGRSVENWGYLVEPHNDFIVAIIGEEMGLIGFLAVCALLAFIVGRTLTIGVVAEKRGEVFGALYAFGFAAMLTAQSFINIGGNLALLPFKGFTLPLLSYGGSSLLATGLMLGVLIRVDYENRHDCILPRQLAS